MKFVSENWRKKFDNIFGADLRSLAVLRIGTGVVLFGDLISRSVDLVDHYTDFGVLPRIAFIESAFSRWVLSLHLLNGTWQVQAALFFLSGVFALALVVGYRTRLATFVSWLLLISLQTRNPIVFDAGDVLLHMLLFWGMFLPWGACYSVDRALRSEWEALPKRCISWATFAYVAQILMVYWFSAALKSGAPWRIEGSAVYYALSIDQMATPFGQYWLQFPELLKYLTFSVLGFEVLGPLMLISPVFFVPLRMLAICGFVVMHLMFALCFDIGLFPLISSCSLLGFLPSSAWDCLLAAFSTSAQNAQLYYDQDCGLCARVARVLKTFFLLPQTVVLPAQTNPDIESEMRKHNSWVVIDGNGKPHFGYDGGLSLMRISPILRPLASLFGTRFFSPVGEVIYRRVSDHQKQNCKLALDPSGTSRVPLKLGPLANFLVPFFLLYVLLWNLGSVPGTPFRLSAPLQSLGWLLRLDQRWNMFAPYPFTDDGWYVIPGKLKNGAVVDLFKGGAPVDTGKPLSVTDTYKNYRWRKYMMNLYYPRHEKQRANYARYLCRDWNARHNGSEKLQELIILYFLERTRPNNQYVIPQELTLLVHKCDDERPFASVDQKPFVSQKEEALHRLLTMDRFRFWV
jgi:hypothetical protein